MHQRVDLQLSLVESVQCRVHHVAVDDLAHPRVQAHLFGRQNGDVVFEDEPGLLFDDFGVGIFLEVFAGQPEEDVLLTVLALEELAEDDATHRTFHQSIERVAPATDFLQTRRDFSFVTPRIFAGDVFGFIQILFLIL